MFISENWFGRILFANFFFQRLKFGKNDFFQIFFFGFLEKGQGLTDQTDIRVSSGRTYVSIEGLIYLFQIDIEFDIIYNII